MTALRSFEVEAIRLMAVGFLTEEQLQAIARSEQLDSYRYTGCGYFLSIKHPALPALRKTLSQPAVVGNSGDIQAGFVVFLENGVLTLECHTWGAVEVPADFRDRQVAISTPPVQFIGDASAI